MLSSRCLFVAELHEELYLLYTHKLSSNQVKIVRIHFEKSGKNRPRTYYNLQLTKTETKSFFPLLFFRFFVVVDYIIMMMMIIVLDYNVFYLWKISFGERAPPWIIISIMIASHCIKTSKGRCRWRTVRALSFTIWNNNPISICRWFCSWCASLIFVCSGKSKNKERMRQKTETTKKSSHQIKQIHIRRPLQIAATSFALNISFEKKISRFLHAFNHFRIYVARFFFAVEIGFWVDVPILASMGYLFIINRFPLPFLCGRVFEYGNVVIFTTVIFLVSVALLPCFCFILKTRHLLFDKKFGNFFF